MHSPSNVLPHGLRVLGRAVARGSPAPCFTLPAVGTLKLHEAAVLDRATPWSSTLSTSHTSQVGFTTAI